MKSEIQNEHEIQCHKLDSHYRVDRLLGGGSFGNVHLAYSQIENRVFAVKTLKNTDGINPLYLREVQFFEGVGRHPNLVGLQEMFVDPDTRLVHFVLEYMDLTLLSFMTRQRGNALPLRVTVDIGKQLTRGIHYIHRRGFVHRDLKPENILVGYRPSTQDPSKPKFVVKLADFGLSRRIDAPDQLTKWSGYVATRWYRAPEQLLALKHHGTPVDIWAFGLLMYELMCLAPLFTGENTSAMLHAQKLVLGSPTCDSFGGNWAEAPEAIKDDKAIRSRQGTDLRLHVSLVAEEPVMILIHKCLQWDPSKRINTSGIYDTLSKLSHQLQGQRQLQKQAQQPALNISHLNRAEPPTQLQVPVPMAVQGQKQRGLQDVTNFTTKFPERSHSWTK